MTSRHIVVGVDGSLNSVRALDWAEAEAVRRGTGLRVLYAVPDRDEAAPVLRYARSRTHARHPELLVETVAMEGGAVRALARESADAELTVVGTRGLGALTGLAFGSVSLRLAALTQGPLLVVRGDHPCGDGRDVLLGLADDTDAEAAAYAFQEAERRGANLRVLHSWNHRHLTPELPSLVPARSPGQERLAREARAEDAVPRYALTRLRDQHSDVTVEARTVRAAPADELLAATWEAAVVVIGAHRRTSVLGPRLGPVAHTLLHRAHCAVVVVPHK
ncbi:universal stress protein [Streptomyces lacrimifluminis]|uniref:Universal stress protein n=1 Tax=Streptomyces lacrimifluminis TaxID=1500077 RepID=A0A917KZA1_9ACTN|nr:universal stress protein [Streptomyces lacrimifluminis]GGJ37075.1 universal stress protein [Streptomyces lacrimifluminis]